MNSRLRQEQTSFSFNRNPITNKVSLKNVRPIHYVSQPNQKQKFQQRQRQRQRQKQKSTTTTYSIIYGNSNSNKNSIKNLLVAARSRNHYSQNYISMTYEDIRYIMQGKSNQQGFLSNILCGLKYFQAQNGCDCGQVCPWMTHWLSLSMKHIMYQPKYLTQVSQQTQQQIKKDLKRTQPNSKTFENPQYERVLYQCLMAYARIDPQIGYVQSMNIICSILVFHSLDVYQCMQVMKFLMMNCNYRQIYLNDFQFAHRLSSNLVQILRYRCHDLYRHLMQKYQVSLGIFAVGWILPMLGNIIPLKHMHMVVNIFIEKSWQGILKIIVSFLLLLRPQLLRTHDETQLMQMLSVQGLKKRLLPWQQIIISSKNVKVGGLVNL